MTTLADVMPEDMLLGKIVRFARRHGWLAYHTYDSRRSEKGFPDLVLVRGDRVIFAELKSAKGKLSPAQEKWRDGLLQAVAEWHLWRPADWPEIEETLK